MIRPDKNFKPRLARSGKNVFVVRIEGVVKAIIVRSGTGKYPWRWHLVFVESPLQTGTSMTRNEAYENVQSILRGEVA